MSIPRILAFGDSALLVVWGARPDLALNRRVSRLETALRASPPPGVVALVPAYASLLVEFDPLVTAAEQVEAALKTRLGALPPVRDRMSRLREIPTVYGGEYGPDLDDVARQTRLSRDDVVALHADTEVSVYMLGFAPGYAYMGDLPRALHLPRRATPRERVAAGSVAIATSQTSIYPVATPGGWHVIGRTPRLLFDVARHPPAYLLPGDRVRHVPVPASVWSDFAGAASDW